MALKSDLFDTIYLDTGSTGTAASITKAKVTTWDSLGTGGVPIKTVANIGSPSAAELGNGTTQGDLILAYQAAASAINNATLYCWDTSSAAESKPYIVAGTGGSWIAIGGAYSTLATAIGSTLYAYSTITANGNFQQRANYSLLNKAGSGWLALITRNTAGAEAVGNLAYIGDVSMSGKLKGGHTDVIYYADLLAATATGISAINPWDNGTVSSFSAQPDVPRCIKVGVSGGNTPAGGGTVTINGLDADGATIAEVITVPSDTGSWSDTTDKAFATVTSAVAASFTGGPFSGTTLNLGWSDIVGLPNYPLNATGDVFKVKKNNANITVPTVVAAYGTVDLATISGGDDYTIWVRPYKA